MKQTYVSKARRDRIVRYVMWQAKMQYVCKSFQRVLEFEQVHFVIGASGA